MLSLFSILTISKKVQSDKESPKENIYGPDVGLGLLKKSNDCRKALQPNSQFFAKIRARVMGQPLPILDTFKSNRTIYLSLSNTKIIPGIRKGIVGACLGEIRRITIPPNYAYDDEQVDGLFPPGSSWVVDIEVVEVLDSVAL